MLHKPIAPECDRVTDLGAPGRIDRSMDALQYAIALLAIAAAVLLASVR